MSNNKSVSFRIKDIDILSQVNSKNVDPSKTGLQHLIDEIRKIAKEVFATKKDGNTENQRVIRNIFIEYSSIAVMLSDSKMIGFAAVDGSNDPKFNDAVKQYAFQIIGALVNDKNNYSILVHPDFISSSAINTYDVGDSHHSELGDCNIESIAEKLKIDLDKLNESIKDLEPSKISNSNYWSGTYSWTYEKLIKSINDYRKKYQDLPEISALFTLFKFYYDLKFGLNADERSCYVGIPLLGAQAGDMPVSGQGAAFIYFTYSKDVEPSKIKDFLSELSPRIDYILKGYLFNLLAYSALYLKDKVREEAIKSAKSAIMSRNMSHNLGSHFISNTKNYFSNLINVDTKNEAIYRGIKNALQYLQERMDFIATITSDDVYPFGAVNAKAQIFDELAPDDLGKRHNTQKSLNFLLDYLVLSEKISKRSYLSVGNGQDKNNILPLLSTGEHELKLRMGYEREGKVVFWDSQKSDVQNNNERDELVEINFAIPGGVLGRHAIFSIIENIIRNAAKHGQDKIGKEFIVSLLYTQDEHLIIYDNKQDAQIKNTVENLNARLSGLEMLTKDGKIDQNNKGLKEILICAVWLQNKNLTDVLNQKNYDDFVRIIAVDANGKQLSPTDAAQGYLAYSIKLPRFNKVIHLDKELDIQEDKKEIDFQQLKDIKADIICACKNYKVGKSTLANIFPRFKEISIEEYDENNYTDYLKEIFIKKCKPDCDDEGNINMKMVISSDTKESEFKGNCYQSIVAYNNYIQNLDENKENSKDDFLFKNHAGKSKYSKFETLYLTKGFENKYIDSISGGDFTHTLTQPSFVGNEYNLLKIYESVKTRIIIIDERIFELYRSSINSNYKNFLVENIKKINEPINDDLANKIKAVLFANYNNLLKQLAKPINEFSEDEKPRWIQAQSMFDKFVKDKARLLDFLQKDIEQLYLERKNIFVFSLNTNDRSNDKQYSLNDLSYNPCGAFKEDHGTIIFESKNGEQFFADDNKNPITFLSIHLGLIDKVKDRLGFAEDKNFDESVIVDALKNYFGANYVAIHSGRGGFDVRESLKKYVFQSFSALENPFHNSKFLLTQQFFGLNYYGTAKE